MIEEACADVSAARSCSSPGEVSVTCFTTSLHDRAAGCSGTGSLGEAVAVGVEVGVGVEIGLDVGAGAAGVGATAEGGGATVCGPENSGSRGWYASAVWDVWAMRGAWAKSAPRRIRVAPRAAVGIGSPVGR